MAWLAVDKNGDELISEGKPNRCKKYPCWECEISIEGEMVNFIIYLPNDTIEKIIGKKLTWDDEPFEI